MTALRIRKVATKRFRLAANDNETIVVDELIDELDTEGHRLAANDNEIVVEGAGPDPEDEEALQIPGARRIRAR
jgi:hypothetical protein